MKGCHALVTWMKRNWPKRPLTVMSSGHFFEPGIHTANTGGAMAARPGVPIVTWATVVAALEAMGHRQSGMANPWPFRTMPSRPGCGLLPPRPVPVHEGRYSFRS